MSNDRLFELNNYSKPYYEFIDSFIKSEYESAKLLGQFYTDYEVAQEMAERCVPLFNKQEYSVLKIIDPFCGDGRLIVNFLEVIRKSSKFKNTIFDITIWEVDFEALQKAEENIRCYANNEFISVKIHASITDSFVSWRDFVGMFDLCLTNPPWGLLKPQKLFNERCTSEELEKYKKNIAIYDEFIKKEFGVSQPTSKFGKWGTNLGRCGLEVALRLISEKGVCGFVSPSSLFCDCVSVPFRKWIFENFSIKNISYYPAELKLYGTADVSSVTGVVQHGKTDNINVVAYDKNKKKTCNVIDKELLKVVVNNEYSIPLEFGIESLSLQYYWDRFSPLLEECKIYDLHFVRELDETRWEENVINEGSYLFVKGYMINRYRFSREQIFVNPEKIEIPKTAEKIKLVWRDVARTSQKRRIKATILPANCVVGNSLGAIYSSRQDEQILKVLLGIFNSYVFEYQARQQLVSNHVPAGVLKKVKIPSLMNNYNLSCLVSMALAGDEYIENEIEVCVANMYGLTLDDFLKIVKHFEDDASRIEILKKIWIEQYQQERLKRRKY